MQYRFSQSWPVSLLFILCSTLFSAIGQSSRCILKDTLLYIDFGAGSTIPEFNATRHSNYGRVFTECPTDGNYSYSSYTGDCFNGDWFALSRDHTLNSDGNMMVVNASEQGGSFFNMIIKDLKPNTRYEFAVWLMNVCRINGGCSPLPPNIHVSIITFTGKKVAEFVTGRLVQSESPEWKKYSSYFTTPANETILGLTMTNTTLGGCGNDFVMDDITVRECVIPEPPAIQKPKVKPAPKPVKPVAYPAPLKTKKEQSIKKDTTVAVITKKYVNIPPPVSQPSVKPGPIPVPAALAKRDNPIVQQLKIAAGELVIDLYDNGQVDGDTVTIYHNNELIVSHAALSEKPVSFRINLNANHPHHELVMVADNLGSIPPNTSLMMVNTTNRRYDIFISSSEQKNAKIVIDLDK